MATDLSRREFVKAGVAVSGLVIALQLPAYAHTVAGTLARHGAVLSPSAFLEIPPDGTLTFWLARSEMGQGVAATLPMIVAEELEVPLDSIQIRQASADLKFGEQVTGGSASISSLWAPLRKASAQAREMLIGAAARTWGVPSSECVAEEGTVRHDASRRRLRYGELVAIPAALRVPPKPTLKDPIRFRLLGRVSRRIDTAPKVDGSARYGLDIRLPGMVFACVARCPVFGRPLTGYDADQARSVAGVIDVVPLEPGEVFTGDIWRWELAGAVAVVADTSWAAMQGCKVLDCRWDADGGTDSEALARVFRDRAMQQGILGRNDGDAEAALGQAARVVEATYDVPFLAHATMEPMNCTAYVRPGRCDVYAPTQAPTDVQRIAEALTGLDGSAVEVHTTIMGGGFGPPIRDGLGDRRHPGLKGAASPGAGGLDP